MRSAIDEEKMSKAHQMDIASPPLREIPRLEFPKMVYDHSKAVPARIEQVRDINGRTTTEHVPANFGHKIVKDEKELKEALKKGYSLEAPDFSTPDEAA